MIKNLLLPLAVLFLFACSGTNKQPAESFKAGFKTIHDVDRSRIYKPGTDTADYLHYRPIDIDIWYPANPSGTSTTLIVRDILGLLEKRANYYTASNAGNGLTQQVAQYLSDNLKCSDSTRVLNYKTRSFKDATAIDNKFPLVIYLSAFNGMSYENFSLFEELAKNGFVVVSISSIGRFPGDMTMKNEDLMEQVNDAIAAIGSLKENGNIDFNRIGLVGYSWGGLVASILANKIPHVACLVSLDGSEFHHYGKEKEENADFDGIKNSPDFKGMRLSMPYLRLESSPSDTSKKEDSVYNFSEKILAGKQIYKIEAAQHEDFSCLPQLVQQSGNCKPNGHFETISNLTISFLADHLKNAGNFTQTVAQELNKGITKQ